MISTVYKPINKTKKAQKSAYYNTKKANVRSTVKDYVKVRNNSTKKST
ncbi:hypothetical protein [Tetragenococcus halophilus]|nr:hypothetical protein [Tetragenococcus halophilus]GFK24868.1 hypothetical protein YA163_19310 [Tetragenococcus halophilus]